MAVAVISGEQESAGEYWLLYRVSYQGRTMYIAGHSFESIIKKIGKIYGPKTKLQGFEMQLVESDEVIVVGR